MQIRMAIRRVVARGHRSERRAGVERAFVGLVAQEPLREHEREIDLADAGRAGDQPGVAEACRRARAASSCASAGSSHGAERRLKRVERRRHRFANPNRLTSARTCASICC